MPARVLVINGHPDASRERLCSALATAYETGARSAGRKVQRIDVGALNFSLIRDAATFTDGNPPDEIRRVQDAIRWADHVVIVHPLWLGTTPALLKGFFEQVFRYGFALQQNPGVGGLLVGRSARIIVTMGMHSLFYEIVVGAFGMHGFERGVLQLSGINPVRHTFISRVSVAKERDRRRWLDRIEALGGAGR